MLLKRFLLCFLGKVDPFKEIYFVIPVEAIDALISLVMEFDIDWFILRIDHLEGMRPIPIHMAVPLGGAPVRKQE